MLDHVHARPGTAYTNLYDAWHENLNHREETVTHLVKRAERAMGRAHPVARMNATLRIHFDKGQLCTAGNSRRQAKQPRQPKHAQQQQRAPKQPHAPKKQQQQQQLRRAEAEAKASPRPAQQARRVGAGPAAQARLLPGREREREVARPAAAVAAADSSDQRIEFFDVPGGPGDRDCVDIALFGGEPVVAPPPAVAAMDLRTLPVNHNPLFPAPRRGKAKGKEKGPTQPPPHPHHDHAHNHNGGGGHAAEARPRGKGQQQPRAASNMPDIHIHNHNHNHNYTVGMQAARDRALRAVAPPQHLAPPRSSRRRPGSGGDGSARRKTARRRIVGGQLRVSDVDQRPPQQLSREERHARTAGVRR